MYDGRDVANRILDICDELHIDISNLALQKILYFCHVWSLIQLGRPLIRNQFEAWEHGPVLPYVYQEFRRSGADSITSRAEKLDKATGVNVIANALLNEECENVVAEAVNFYARLSPSQLVGLSHVRGGPWWTSWEHQGEINPGMKISDLDIARYYSAIRQPFIIQ